MLTANGCEEPQLAGTSDRGAIVDAELGVMLRMCVGGVLIADGKWWQLAACRSAGRDLFFPISSTDRSLEQAAEARAICARCAVRPHCLAFALQTRQVQGIGGGLSEEERHQPANTNQGT